MKVLFLILAIFIVTVCCKKRCHPVKNLAPKLLPGFSDKPCPNRPYVKDFDVKKAKGIWYTVRTYISLYSDGLSCYVLRDTPSGSNQYDHKFCEKIDGNYSCMDTVVSHPNQDGNFTFDIKEESLVGSGFYFHIDYDHYYISYVCENLENGGSQTNVWLESRTPTLDQKYIAKAYKKMRKHFDVESLEAVIQDEKTCGIRPIRPGLSDQSCPERPFEKTFDVEQAKGIWYPIKAYRSIYFQSMDCHSFNFAPTGPFAYNDTYCEKPSSGYTCRDSQVEHSNQDGKFDFLANDRSLLGSGYYLYIKYDTYFINYVCTDLENGQSQTGVWIASRTATLSEDLLAEAYDRMKDHFDINSLESINQDENLCEPRRFV